MTELWYILMLAFFATHELDAVQRHEWRVLPLTSFLPEAWGARVFVWAHVPIFALLFGFGGFDPHSNTAIGLSVFSLVHVGLHYVFRKHPMYAFNTIGSWAIIIGTGVFGALHLVALTG